MTTPITDTPCYVTMGATTVEGRIWQFAPLMPCADDDSEDADTYRARNAGKTATCEVYRIKIGQAPVGDLRLAPPQPYILPDGPYDATGMPTAPYQEYAQEKGTNGRPEWGMQAGGANYTSMGAVESEDMLYVTVYTPNSGATDLPVIYFVHGGGWDVSTSMNYYDRAHRLSATRGVVVVSIEYRLAHFGALWMAGMAAEGILPNFALYDQRLGLQWTNTNVAKFGGDPNNVTILGPSAGGASVLTLLETTSVHALFARAWVSSGGGLGHRYRDRPSWQNEGYLALSDRYRRTLFAFRDAPDYSGTYATVGDALDNEDELWVMRHAISPDQIAFAHSGEVHGKDPVGGQNHFPWMTADLPHENAYEACKAGAWPENTPVVFGVAQNEASVLGIARVSDNLNLNADGYARVVGRVGGREFRASDFFDGMDWHEQNRMMYASVIYWAPAHLMAYERASNSEYAVTYLWNYKDPGNALDYASHTVDINYLFGNLEWATGMSGPEAALRVQSIRLSEAMMDNLANYAKHGDFETSYDYEGNWDVFETNTPQPFVPFTTDDRTWNVVGNLTRNANDSPPTVSHQIQWYNNMLESYRASYGP